MSGILQSHCYWLEKVWVDLSGPHDVISRTGGQYVMNIVDDHTSFIWPIILKNRSDAFPALQIWGSMHEKMRLD
jgi:hypothetical protein